MAVLVPTFLVHWNSCSASEVKVFVKIHGLYFMILFLCFSGEHFTGQSEQAIDLEQPDTVCDWWWKLWWRIHQTVPPPKSGPPRGKTDLSVPVLHQSLPPLKSGPPRGKTDSSVLYQSTPTPSLVPSVVRQTCLCYTKQSLPPCLPP